MLVGKSATFNRQRISFGCMTRSYDISKAKVFLGYKRLVPLDEGIRRWVAWCIKQHEE
ncbi:hypothetical protein GGR57DRAFT_475629 [Xylariaceae sp. FL1272]|nr:hypothetical protein GGR57DRAFT_475629 [Xylariaceae sp. FL1272]